MGGWVALIPVTVNLWWPHAELASLLLGNVCCVPVSATAFLPLSALSANTKANVAHRMSFFLPVRLQAQPSLNEHVSYRTQIFLCSSTYYY